MDNELKDMLNAIIEEIDHNEERIKNRMDEGFRTIEKRFDNIQSEINACKLNNDTVSLLLHKIDELEKRIAELERKTA